MRDMAPKLAWPHCSQCKVVVEGGALLGAALSSHKLAFRALQVEEVPREQRLLDPASRRPATSRPSVTSLPFLQALLKGQTPGVRKTMKPTQVNLCRDRYGLA